MRLRLPGFLVVMEFASAWWLLLLPAARVLLSTLRQAQGWSMSVASLLQWIAQLQVAQLQVAQLRVAQLRVVQQEVALRRCKFDRK